MLLLQLWLAGSIGFVLGWVLQSALAKRRAELQTSEVHTIDLEDRQEANRLVVVESPPDRRSRDTHLFG